MEMPRVSIEIEIRSEPGSSQNKSVRVVREIEFSGGVSHDLERLSTAAVSEAKAAWYAGK